MGATSQKNKNKKPDDVCIFFRKPLMWVPVKLFLQQVEARVQLAALLAAQAVQRCAEGWGGGEAAAGNLLVLTTPSIFPPETEDVGHTWEGTWKQKRGEIWVMANTLTHDKATLRCKRIIIIFLIIISTWQCIAGVARLSFSIAICVLREVFVCRLYMMVLQHCRWRSEAGYNWLFSLSDQNMITLLLSTISNKKKKNRGREAGILHLIPAGMGRHRVAKLPLCRLLTFLVMGWFSLSSSVYRLVGLFNFADICVIWSGKRKANIGDFMSVYFLSFTTTSPSNKRSGACVTLLCAPPKW